MKKVLRENRTFFMNGGPCLLSDGMEKQAATAGGLMFDVSLPSWLEKRLAGRTLTAGNRRILKAIAEDPASFMLVSVKDFARLAQVSPATVIRFVRLLGYSAYSEFQQELKANLFQPGKLTSVFNYLEDKESNGWNIIEQIRQAESEELARSLAALDQNILQSAASLAAGAERIHLMGFGSSIALTRFLQYRLMRIGLDVVDMTSVSGINMLAEHCVHMMPRRDVIITVSFRGVYETINHLLHFAEAFRIPSIAFSENAESEISRLSTWRIPIRRAVIHEFKSLAVPMSIMNLFVMQTAAFIDAGKSTIARRLVWFRQYQEKNGL